MTGLEIVTRALVLLNYTNPAGEVDSNQNAEQLRRALPILNTVLADIAFIRRTKPVPVTDLNAEPDIPEEVAVRLAVPGVAMYLAQGEGDADNYNRWANEYIGRRSGVSRAPERVVDVSPRVEI